jgi:hypothetical protein
MRLYYGELSKKAQKSGKTFRNRHDILKGYTRRNFHLLQVVIKTLGNLN